MTHQEDDIIPPVSNSELTTWTDCHRKWYLAFYLKMGLKRTERPLTGALAFGTRIHAALDRMYTNKENPIEVIEELFSRDTYELVIRETTRGYPDEETRKELQKERELAHAMLEGFVEWLEETGIDEGMQVVGAEVVVEVASGIPGVRLRGKLDQRIYREIDGARLFRDWKTVGNLTDGPMLLPLNEQFKFYQMLERLDALEKYHKEITRPEVAELQSGTLSASQSESSVMDVSPVQHTCGRPDCSSQRSRRDEQYVRESSSNTSELSSEAPRCGCARNSEDTRTSEEAQRGRTATGSDDVQENTRIDREGRTNAETTNKTTEGSVRTSGGSGTGSLTFGYRNGQRLEPELTQGAIITYLKKVKRTSTATPPFYDQVEVRHNRAALESMWFRTHKRLQEILEARKELDAGGDHRYWVYPRPSHDCKWKCQFFAICPMMDDGSDWEGVLNEYYERVDPYERYVDDETKGNER